MLGERTDSPWKSTLLRHEAVTSGLAEMGPSDTVLLMPLNIVIVVVLLAACTDLWRYRIYNSLTIPFFLTGLMYHGYFQQPLGLAGSVMGVLVGTLPFVGLYAIGGMGAGDIKLLAGVGAWLGPWYMLHVMIVSGLATGVVSAALTIRNRMQVAIEPGDTLTQNADTIEQSVDKLLDQTPAVRNERVRRYTKVPFGAMVALGVVVTAVWIG